MSELTITYRGAVYASQCDHMGHMNVTWYVAKFDEATWNLLALLGATPSYFRQQKYVMGAVQQNITYKRELRAGDIVTVRSGVLEIRERVVRFVHEMKNEETGEISAIAVLTGVHIDAQTRKSCPFPEHILARGRELVIEYDLGT